jgi:hypothetical protein
MASDALDRVAGMAGAPLIAGPPQPWRRVTEAGGAEPSPSAGSTG